MGCWTPLYLQIVCFSNVGMKIICMWTLLAFEGICPVCTQNFFKTQNLAMNCFKQEHHFYKSYIWRNSIQNYIKAILNLNLAPTLFFLYHHVVMMYGAVFSRKSDSRDSVVRPLVRYSVHNTFSSGVIKINFNHINFIHQSTLITIHLFNFSSPLSRLLRLLVLFFLKSPLNHLLIELKF